MSDWRACTCDGNVDVSDALGVECPIHAFRQREGDQPLPKPADGPVMHELLIERIQERLDLGVRRYGQPLRAFNGRNAGQDALEEVLDLAVYLQQSLIERDALIEALLALWSAPVGRHAFVEARQRSEALLRSLGVDV